MGKKNNILLHCCCGPCGVYPVKVLREEGFSLRGFFYNPYIQPFAEHQRRLDALRDFARQVELPVIYDESYELEDYIRSVSFREGERCRICYHKRIERTARLAKKSGYDGFATTLLYSKLQKHELIKEICEAQSAEFGVAFIYRDFREGWREGIEGSKEMGLYRQQYCGCILSERDRFQPGKK